jgi:putative ABC transport system permease protein
MRDASVSPPSILQVLFFAFVWRMAWRDSRRSRGRLLVFSTALTLGVAALVAIGSLGWNLNRAINEQARSLVGADLVLEARQSLDPEADAFIRSLGGEQARETRLASMAELPNGSRLAQVRAVEGNFPFYGAIETEPPQAAEEFRQGRGVLIEESLLLQYGAKPGDDVRIGGRAFPILGTLKKLPGEANAFVTFAPRVLMPRDQLPPALTVRGSLVRHIAYLKLPAHASAPDLVRRLKPQLTKYRLDTDTVDRRKRSLGRAFGNVNRFLNLVGFVSLLLGGIGVASAIQAHLKQKLRTVAILRCLGASEAQTVIIYLIQALALGLVGSLSGAVLGLLIQSAAPMLLKGALPVEVQFGISWGAVGQGIGIGLTTCALFVLLPLLPVRRIPPLLALRSAFDHSAADIKTHDPMTWLAYALLAAGLIAFPVAQSRDVSLGLWFSGGLFAAFGLLALVARAMMTVSRKYFPRSWPFEWRQGVANLYRPNNRTFLLVFTLGLSTFLLLGTYLTQDVLLRQFNVKDDAESRPNLVFFDIQTDQKDAVAAIVRSHGLPMMGMTPVVTMRLASLKGRTVDQIAEAQKRARQGDGDNNKKPPGAIPEWRLRHEYRSTYRSYLTDAEEIVAGQWGERANGKTGANAASAIPISMEVEAAKEMQLTVGDLLVFDVQGVPMTARVANLRKVDWSRFQPNFFVVFPLGVLEDAPTFNVLATRAPNAAALAATQAEIVQKFPTVSAIDLSLIAATIKGIIDKATAAVRFLSIFTVGTGILVLAAAIFTGRYERVKEGVLLRTLGASRRQIFRILCVEYLCLGTLAAFTGIILAGVGNWALAVFVFKAPWSPAPGAMAASWFFATGLTLAIGLSASRGVCDHPPLEVLRAED